MNLTVAQLTDLKLEDPRTWRAAVPAPSVRMTLIAVVISLALHIAGLLVPITAQTTRPTTGSTSRHELDLTLVPPTPPKAAPAPKPEHPSITTPAVQATRRIPTAPTPLSVPRPEPRAVVTTIERNRAARVNEQPQRPIYRREIAKAAPVVPAATVTRHKAHPAGHKAKASMHHARRNQAVIRPEPHATAKRATQKPAPAEPTPTELTSRQSSSAKPVSQPPAKANPTAGPKVEAQAQQQAFRQALMTWIGDHRRYPRLARIRGWQGQVLIRAQIARDGHLLGLTLERSSGYPMLDDAAMHLIRSALEAVPQPAGDSGIRTLSIPVTFHLTG